MKLKPYNLGACGLCQMFHAGTVKFDTDEIANGVAICEVPAGTIVTRAIAVVTTAFNAATTNVLTVGKKTNANEILGTADITEGTAGTYQKNVFVDMGAETKIYAKYTQTDLTIEVGTNVTYASYANDGHWLNPKGVATRWVPGYWNGEHFIYQPGAKTGMLLKQKWVEGSHYFDSAVRIMDKMLPKLMEAKMQQWIEEYFSEYM